MIKQSFLSCVLLCITCVLIPSENRGHRPIRKLHSNEELPVLDEQNLTPHIELWDNTVGMIENGFVPLRSRMGTEISFTPVAKAKLPFLFGFVVDYYVCLKKRIGVSGLIQLDTYTKSFSAQHCNLARIDTFLGQPISSALTHIHFDHNNLTSYQELHDRVLTQCRSLRTFTAAHNKLDGVLYLTHAAITTLDLSHNLFKYIAILNIPRCSNLDLSRNPMIMDVNYALITTFTSKMLETVHVPQHNHNPPTAPAHHNAYPTSSTAPIPHEESYTEEWTPPQNLLNSSFTEEEYDKLWV